MEEVSDWTLGDTVQLGILLLVGNIPTFVLLGTYYIGRGKAPPRQAAGEDAYTGLVKTQKQAPHEAGPALFCV